MYPQDAVQVIEKLIEVCKAGEKGYEDAAEHVKRSDLKIFFITQSSERGRFARELQTALMNWGTMEKKESGTIARVLHTLWIDAKISLAAGDKSIVASVGKGEDEARDAYREAIGTPLPPNVADMVSHQARRIQIARAQVKSLGDAFAA